MILKQDCRFQSTTTYWREQMVILTEKMESAVMLRSAVSGCLGYQKFWFHNFILLGVPKYWKPSCIVFLFRGSEILYPLLCCLGIQKFWILSCVVWGSEILNPLLCCLGVRNSESSPLFLGDEKFWILFRVVWGIIRRLLGRILWSLQTGRRFLWVLTPV